MPIVRAANTEYTPYPTVTPEVQVPPNTFRLAADPAAFGLPQGQALSQLGRTGEEVGDRFAAVAMARQEIQNQVDADDRQNKYQLGENNLLRGDPNHPEKPGYFQLRGQAARDAWPSTAKALIDLRESLKGTLPNSRSQLMFDQETRRLQAYTLASMGQHYDTESKVFEDTVAKAKFSVAQQQYANAAANNDAEGMARAAAKMKEALDQQADLRGTLTPEVHQHNTDIVTDFANMEEVRRLERIDEFAALEYMQQHPQMGVGAHADEYHSMMQHLLQKTDNTRRLIDIGAIAPPPGYKPEGGLPTDLDLEPYSTGNAKKGGPSPWTTLQPVYMQRFLAVHQGMIDDGRSDLAARLKLSSGGRTSAREEEVNPGHPNSHHIYGIGGDIQHDEEVEAWITAHPQYGMGFPLPGAKEANHMEVMDYDPTTGQSTRVGGAHPTPAAMLKWIQEHSPNHEPVKTAASELSSQDHNAITPSVRKAVIEVPPSPTPMPAANFPIPPHDISDPDIPDESIPGLAEAVARINSLPAEQVERKVKDYIAARKFFGQQVSEEKRKLSLAQQQSNIVANRAFDNWVKKIYSDAPPSEADIMNDSWLRDHGKERNELVTILNNRMERPVSAASDALNRRTLRDRIISAAGSEGHIGSSEAFHAAVRPYLAANSISEKTYSELREDVEHMQTEQGKLLADQERIMMDRAKSYIYGPLGSNPMMRNYDAQAHPGNSLTDQVASFENMMKRKVKEYQDAGKNPADIFDQNKKGDFIGGMETLGWYLPPNYATPSTTGVNPTAKPEQRAHKPLPEMNATELNAYGAQGWTQLQETAWEEYTRGWLSIEEIEQMVQGGILPPKAMPNFPHAPTPQQ
jgi:hypothetical protein